MPPIQITGTLFNHSIPAIIHSERAGIRTPDNLIKSQVLYQLSYTPLFNYIPFNYKENAQSRNRTSDTRIFSPLLYQLSYLGLNTIYLWNCGSRIWTCDLRVMSPTSFQTAPSRDMKLIISIEIKPMIGLEPITCWLQISCSANWATSACLLLL